MLGKRNLLRKNFAFFNNENLLVLIQETTINYSRNFFTAFCNKFLRCILFNGRVKLNTKAKTVNLCCDLTGIQLFFWLEHSFITYKNSFLVKKIY